MEELFKWIIFTKPLYQFGTFWQKRMHNNKCNKDSLTNWDETDLLAQDRIRIQITSLLLSILLKIISEFAL